jgi:hypothetical protein
MMAEVGSSWRIRLREGTACRLGVSEVAPLSESCDAYDGSLHKRFHSANGPLVESENLLLATDCLKVTLFGREDVIRNAQKIKAVRGWLDSRSDLWVENFLHAPDQGTPLIVIRACSRPAGTSDSYVYLEDDWVGFNPGSTPGVRT